MTKNREYSDETAAKVKAAFDEIDARGEVVMRSEIARMVRLSSATVTRVLHDAPYWTAERSQAALLEASRRGRVTLAANGWQGLKKGRVTLAANDWPNIQKMRAKHEMSAAKVRGAFDEIDARGEVVMPCDIAHVTGLSITTVRRVLRDAPYWTLERSHAAQLEGWRRGAASNAAQGYQNLQKGRATLEATGYPNLQKSRSVRMAQGWQSLQKGSLTVARQSRGRPLPRTHSIVQNSQRRRYGIYVTLAMWDDAHDGARTQLAIARAVGVTTAPIHRHLRRLRADGLIDATNRVIAPWPDDAINTPTVTSDEMTADSADERAERE